MKTKEKKSNILHFSIEGEGMTRIARDTWMSDLPLKAFNIIFKGLRGISEKMSMDILLGNLKIVGDTRDGDGSLQVGKDSGDYSKEMGIDVSLKGVLRRKQTKYRDTFMRLSGLKRTRRLYVGLERDKDDTTPGLLEPGLASPSAGVWRASNYSKKNNDVNGEHINELEELLLEYSKDLEFLSKHAEFNMFEFVTSLTTASLTNLSEPEIKGIEESERYVNADYSPYKIKDQEDKKLNQEELDEYAHDLDELNKNIKSFNKSMGDKLIMTVEDLNTFDNYLSYTKKLNAIRNEKTNVPHENIRSLVPKFTDPETEKSVHAYITPDGRLYPVGCQEHHYMEDDYLDAGLGRDGVGIGIAKTTYGNNIDWLESGWIKISSAEVMCSSVLKDNRSEAQMETLTVYLLSNGQEFSWWRGTKEKDPMKIVQQLKSDDFE